MIVWQISRQFVCWRVYDTTPRKISRLNRFDREARNMTRGRAGVESGLPVGMSLVCGVITDKLNAKYAYPQGGSWDIFSASILARNARPRHRGRPSRCASVRGERADLRS